MTDDPTKTREAHAASQRGLLHVVDAVIAEGHKPSINAVYRALGEHTGGAVVDERNKLRREVVDLRDTLADMTAERDAAKDEASEKATQVVTLELRAEDAEAATDRVRALCKRAQSDGTAYRAESGALLVGYLTPDDVLAALDQPDDASTPSA